jgi:hypothetical protein
MATRGTTGIKRRLYQVAQRATTTFATPADAAAWTALLATFTEVGYVQRPSLTAGFEKGDVEELDDASELVLGYNFELSFKALQTEAAAISEFEALQGDALDIMLYNENAERAVVYQNVIANVFDTIVGGETDAFNFSITKRNAAAITDVRTHFDIPQV